ncbi:Hypothetical predicted protein [Podarcis lilfordi]|uniref:Uncharacterized protein n=1 Tax=Podarcis lilfordi TaxID=74358 RepID=A0AA35JV22_9SAUR|nr:Hypothetical predicted protein [Podarcis lilfordi]
MPLHKPNPSLPPSSSSASDSGLLSATDSPCSLSTVTSSAPNTTSSQSSPFFPSDHSLLSHYKYPGPEPSFLGDSPAGSSHHSSASNQSLTGPYCCHSLQL